MALAIAQRHFVAACAVEIIGIVALATRFGADRGGVPLLLTGGLLVLVGLGWQIRAIVRTPGQHVSSDVVKDA